MSTLNGLHHEQYTYTLFKPLNFPPPAFGGGGRSLMGNTIWQISITIGFPIMMYLIYKYCEAIAEELDKCKKAIVLMTEIISEMEKRK